MKRREALKRIALLSGGALSMSTITAVMSGCSSGPGGYTPQTLSAHQDELVTQISELIIPATDTPGAKAANVNQFIDKMLTDWNSEEEKKHFLEGLNTIDPTSQELHGAAFLDLSEEQQVAVLEQKQQEAKDNPMSTSGLKSFFDMMKEYTLVGYYTSEIGATQELEWNHVAGRYDGCYPYSEVGRAWSS
ncbi:gluconate 2-dehydrogenase subunit 3 family protein [Aliifodinibius sp. S!AR15-10]|uniref:gluconate 2-dehydrogenase subunit 3 family protein n=1 Tax=Aliifodinibius sp. S!AR15-10 TaxID=2950437 RepID=UPI0028644B4D|nr:gluconate 2-dehydrogenase subunit 3 family protein [Aliifodinibius sp. S!AR15-10]MDR8392525.1 gluconate 2-dehydrogenase subunit 3 family protein [Aliifodinibius sp. S!AR15-10]